METDREWKRKRVNFSLGCYWIGIRRKKIAVDEEGVLEEGEVEEGARGGMAMEEEMVRTNWELGIHGWLMKMKNPMV